MIGWQIQNVALIGIFFLILSLLTFILLYMYRRNLHEKKHGKWRLISDLLIRKAVFYEDEEIEEDTEIPVTDRAKKLMNDKHFRKLLTQEIISAKKNISGTASENLKHLYIQLGLGRYALKKFKSSKWYVIAEVIQELTLMEMKEFVYQLYYYANDENEHVRMEAQSALVQFEGFQGLSFLDFVSYPISDWQQIKLLQQLSLVPPENIDLSDWIKSKNNSVVIFALKLARIYQRFDIYDEIVKCLDHPDGKVRSEAIFCLNEIYTDETADQFISRFLEEDDKHRVEMVKAMRTMSTERDVLFLTDILDYDNDELKFCAAEALAKSGEAGLRSLEEHAAAVGGTLIQIVQHVKSEIAA
ncbi:MAG: HEAT repeat domain-containing protein [Mucilaginibacter sp.]